MGMQISPWRVIAGTGQALTVGAADVTSTAVGAQTYAVRLSTTGNCHVAIGNAPAAASTDALIKASDPPQVFAIGPGQKVSVIQDAASTGTLNLVELTH